MEQENNTQITVEEKKTGRGKVFNRIRNVFVTLTAICFITSFFLHEQHLLLRGIGYCFGAVAYFAELLEMTEVFHRKKYMDDLFMAVCFGVLYLALAVSDGLEHIAH